MKIITTDKQRLMQRQSLPLDAKIYMSIRRIQDWYDHWDGNVYISFSGGKDSLVLADLVWSIYPDVPALFSNTGLEYPEIVQFVKRLRDQGRPIVITRPKRTFRDVVQNEGFALVSKKVSRQVRQIRENSPNAQATIKPYNTGIKKDGTYSKNSKLAEKWRPLIDAPFDVSEKCCDVLKKEPFYRYERETGRKPLIGVMSEEGGG